MGMPMLVEGLTYLPTYIPELKFFPLIWDVAIIMK
jgi:hypothetical protein